MWLGQEPLETRGIICNYWRNTILCQGSKEGTLCKWNKTTLCTHYRCYILKWIQNPIHIFLLKFASKQTFFPDIFPSLKSAVPFQPCHKTLYREGFLWLWSFFTFFSHINYFEHRGKKQGGSWTGRTSAPTQLLGSVWDCAGQMISVLPLHQVSRCSIFQHPHKNSRQTSNFLIHFLMPPSPTF